MEPRIELAEINKILANIEGLVATDGKTLADLEAESLEAERQREAARRDLDERSALIDYGFPRRAIDALDFVTGGRWGEALKLAYRWALNPGSIIVLNGRYGTGKTVMATYIARLLKRRKKLPKYAKTYDYTMELRETFNGSGETESTVMARYKKPYFLVLDEFHEVNLTDFSIPAIERLVDYRHQNEKVTAILANYKPEELEPPLGQPIVSRIHLSGGIITCDWPSFREE